MHIVAILGKMFSTYISKEFLFNITFVFSSYLNDRSCSTKKHHLFLNLLRSHTPNHHI